tara:strand:- start:1657 stop:2304 length:648 start_codon:yes stop_codon:yes gene_type:complete
VPVSGKMKIEGQENLSVFYGSGVIVRPRILITASHVVQDTESSHVIFGDKKIKILGYVCPKADQDKEVGPLDIAVCLLEEEIKLDFYPELYDKKDEMGKLCSLAGWGMNGTWTTGIVASDKKRRAGSNYVDNELFQGMIVCSVDKPPYTSLEYLIGNGDSGGGLFIDKKLAGVHSCIFTDDGRLDSSRRDWSAHTRVSIHKKWIDDIIEIFEKKD